MSDNHPFELRETVEHAIAQFAGAAGELDLISHLSEDCPVVVTGDVVRLRQVLANLVGNAIKFTEHGDVLLRVELMEAPPADRQAGDRVRLRFTVADTGIGISPERLARLFTSFNEVDPVTSRVYGGTGLGLTISKEIVEAMGGELTVTSTLGGGSEFTFDVVLGRFEDRRSVRRSRPENVELALFADRNILVIDDDTDRRALRRQVEEYGMVCTSSDSPLDALALVGGGRTFDLAILDFARPMMDGVQLALALRRLPAGHRLPLILLSSVDRSDHSHDTLFAAILTKPTQMASLLGAIARVLSPGPLPEHRGDLIDQRGSWIAPHCSAPN